jgi:DNA-binding MarR family transcriptional regulator
MLKNLRALRAFEKQHFGFLQTLEDLNLVREVALHQAEGKPLTLKQMFLLDIGSVATVQRRLRRLKEEGVIQQRRSAADARSVELTVAPRYARAFEKYEMLLSGESHGAELGHLCSFCDSDSAASAVLARYLIEGLRLGERCILVAPAAAREKLLSAVNGARDRVVFFEGGQDPRAQLSFLKKLFAAARAAGERVRVAGCMRWTLAKGYSLDQVMEYEARLDALIRRYSASVLCVYHVGHFSSDAVRRALKTHPDAVRHPLVAA